MSPTKQAKPMAAEVAKRRQCQETKTPSGGRMDNKTFKDFKFKDLEYNAQ